jgi:hypothetical protein
MSKANCTECKSEQPILFQYFALHYESHAAQFTLFIAPYEFFAHPP